MVTERGDVVQLLVERIPLQLSFSEWNSRRTKTDGEGEGEGSRVKDFDSGKHLKL